MTKKIWCGSVSIGGGQCDECHQQGESFYPISPDRCACRACALDPALKIAAIDHRGDSLTPDQVARELTAQTAIAIHVAILNRAEDQRKQAEGALHVALNYGEPPLSPLQDPKNFPHLKVIRNLPEALGHWRVRCWGLDKNANFIRLVLGQAWEEGIKIPSLERLCKSILEFAAAHDRIAI